MKKKLTSNLGLKILSLIFSVVLWLIVVNINDPVGTKPFYSIPVEIANKESITGQGKIYEILDGTETVDVVVRAKRSILDSLSKDNIKAVADMDQLTFMDTVAIKPYSNKYSDKIESITTKTENLKVSIENMQRNQLEIICKPTGELPAGYILGEATTDQTLVRLTGPESVISKVDKAVASVDVSGITTDISTTVELKLYDAEDNLMTSPNIVKNIDSVKVNVKILATAQVPLQVSAVGAPAPGYIQSGEITGVPSTVVISGGRAAVAAVSMIELPGVSIEGQSSTVITTVKVKDYLPDNVNYAGNAADSKITITIPIEKAGTRTLEVPVKNITLTDTPENFRGELGELPETIQVSVSGLTADINTLDARTITGTVSWNQIMKKLGVDNLAAGTYSGEVAFQLPDGISLSAAVNVEAILHSETITE